MPSYYNDQLKLPAERTYAKAKRHLNITFNSCQWIFLTKVYTLTQECSIHVNQTLINLTTLSIHKTTFKYLYRTSKEYIVYTVVALYN